MDAESMALVLGARRGIQGHRETRNAPSLLLFPYFAGKLLHAPAGSLPPQAARKQFTQALSHLPDWPHVAGQCTPKSPQLLQRPWRGRWPSFGFYRMIRDSPIVPLEV